MTKREIAFLNTFAAGQVWKFGQNDQDDQQLRAFAAAGLVQPREDLRPGLWELTAEGRSALEQWNEDVENAAEKMRQQRAEKKKDRIFDLVKLVLGGVIALFFEHIAEIFAFIKGLFH